MNIEKEIEAIVSSINDTDVSDMKGILNISEKVDRLLELKNTQATNEVKEILDSMPPKFVSSHHFNKPEAEKILSNSSIFEIIRYIDDMEDWRQTQLKLLDETT